MKAIINCSFLLLFFLSACNSNKTPSIIGCWNTTAITENDKDLKRVATGDVFCLNQDSTFNYYLQKEMILATGKWSLGQDSVLSLDYDYLPGNFGVDSVVVKDSGLLEYYVRGRVVKRIGLSRNLTKDKDFDAIYKASKDISRATRNYQIQKVSEKKLQFSEKGILFSYSKN